MKLKTLFSRNRITAPERTVYDLIVAQARQPFLYADLLVPDTLDGRYDMIIIHADAVMCHMQQGNLADKEFAQALIDEVFRDMDRSLREMGVGDMGVGKRIKKMATVYYGRASAYATARGQGEPAMVASLARNVYAGDSKLEPQAVRLSAYVAMLHDAIKAQERTTIRNGGLELPSLHD